VPVSTTNLKPSGVQIDELSKKIIAEVKVVDGKLVLTPATGFSGKKTVTVTITENGIDRIIQIPLTVLPESVEKPITTPSNSGKSTIKWSASPNATSYSVIINGKKSCSTTINSCSIPRIVGPKTEILVIANGGDSTVSQKVTAEFKLNTSVQVTRLVGTTNIKKSLSSVDITALYKVISLIKSEGFQTVVISQVTKSKKTQALDDARIIAIQKFVQDKVGSSKVKFEVVPASSRTNLNVISVKI
jgi:hypothetical protein